MIGAGGQGVGWKVRGRVQSAIALLEARTGAPPGVCGLHPPAIHAVAREYKEDRVEPNILGLDRCGARNTVKQKLLRAQARGMWN